MTRGKKRKTKKFVQYYGSEYVEKFEEEKRKKQEKEKKEDVREVPTRGTEGPI